PHDLRPADRRLGQRHLPWLRRDDAVGRDQARSGLHDAALLPLGGPDHPREHGLRRAHVRHGGSQGRCRSRDRGSRPHQPPGPARGRALGRLEAAARARVLPAAQAQAAAAGRADRRRRSQGAARFLGRAAPHVRARHDGAGLHALHGRGRALPPAGLHRLRQAARARHVRGTAGEVRRAESRGAVHPADAGRRGQLPVRIPRLSLSRWIGIMLKEFIQLKRDRLTFGMIIGIPVIQLILFGYAINSDPRQLPTAVLVADNGYSARTVLWALKNSSYFRIEREVRNEAEAEALLARGTVQFVVTVPENFSRKVARGERPALLVEADATDPSATGNAIAALTGIARSALARDLQGSLSRLNPEPDPVDLRIHRRYNPENVTQYNIVPGLLGVILTMTMILMTGLAMTRERERGTFENLLATPALPIEVMTGKI